MSEKEATNNAMSEKHAANNKGSGEDILRNKFLIPSPIPTRRTRTYSSSERAAQGETYKGKITEFCRNKGHGFILCEDTNQHIFVHISDIEGEFVPKENDDVTYKLCPLPFNQSKKQAVHVRITHLAPGVTHETWNAPVSPTSSPRS